MDFSNRGTQPMPIRPVASDSESGSSSVKSKGKRATFSKGWRATFVVLLFSIAILLVAVASLFAFGKNGESSYLSTSALQAIDINIAGTSPTNQVYFGHVKNLNDRFFVIQDVYFFQASSDSSSTSTTLEPLVCQIDKPFNQMIVNRSSVNWWENLQSDGQVAKTITQYEKDNPKGPTCPTTSTSSTSTTPTTKP